MQVASAGDPDLNPDRAKMPGSARRTVRILQLVLVCLSLLALGSPVAAYSDPASEHTFADDDHAYANIGEEYEPLVYGGGDVTNPGWVTALFWNGSFICTASLIHPQVVLTAAHCVDTPGTFTVLVGEESLTGSGITRNVTEIHSHPGFGGNFNDTDLALLGLDEPVTSVSLAQLNPTGAWPELGQTMGVMGWGEYFEGSGASTLLQAGGVFATSGMDGSYDPAYCNLDPAAMTVGGSFCYGGPVTTKACSGDSGGPVYGWSNPTATSGDLVIYGVVSYGPDFCGPTTFDGVAQSVGGHSAWIDMVVDLIVLNTPPKIGSVVTTDATGAVRSVFAPGEVVALNYSFSDPNAADTHTVVVSWGDATTSSSGILPAGTRFGSMSHEYVAAGALEISTSVRDSAGGEDSASTPVEITGNTPPQVVASHTSDHPSGAAQSTFQIGDSVYLIVQFTDPDLTDGHVVELTWGDGSPVIKHTVSPGAREFNLPHTYTSAGAFDIVYTVVDSAGGDTGPRTSGVVVEVAAPDLRDSVGSADRSTGLWHLPMANTPPTDPDSFYYGDPGDYAILGDWDCSGIETPGLYRRSDGYVYLRDSSTQGIADIKFFFGDPGDLPLAGDFNGDGCDTVSVYRPEEARIFIINQLGQNNGGLGAAEYDFYFGDAGDKPFVGDFDGDGIDTIGLHRESTGLVYYRDSNTTGIADNEFIFGDPGDRIFAGDWTGNGIESPGVYRSSNGFMYLKYSNSTGPADYAFAYMVDGEQWPVAGYWGP